MDEDQTPAESPQDGTPDSAPGSAPGDAPAAAATTPTCERTHRVHWFTGRLGEVLDGLLGPDGRAGLALSVLGPEQPAEGVVGLPREIARLQGLEAEPLAHADAVDVAAHATPVATSTRG